MSRRIRAPRVRSFKNRLLILIVGLIGLAEGATLILALSYVHRDVSHTANQDLLTARTVLMQQLEVRQQRMAETAGVLISDFGFKEAVASSDAATIRSALANQVNRIGATLAVLYDPEGHALAASPDDFPLSSARSGLLPPSLNGDSGAGAASFYAIVDGRCMQVVLIPLRAPEPIAWVAFGFALDASQERSFGELVDAEVKFVAAPRGGHAFGNPDAVRLTRQGGKQYLVLATPLNSRGGSLTLEIRRSLTAVMQPYRNVRNALLIIAAVALAGAIGIALIAGQSAARPVQVLSAAVRRIEAGRYDEPVQVRGASEFEKLARSFNGMQVGLRDREQRIRYQATHDALTGLSNRAGLRSRLSELLDGGSAAEVVLIDIHRFRDINASLEREAADAVLRAIATRLAHTAPPDRVGRLGADQFGIILDTGGIEAATQLASRLAEDLRNGVSVGEARFTLLIRAGVSSTTQGARDADDLLRQADVALLEAKERGVAVVCYEASHDAQHRRSVSLLAELRRAIAQNHLTLAYQPLTRTGDGALVHFEALIRWTHPTLGMISPAEFVPLAERASAISDLTQWVLGAAIRQIRQWQQAGHSVRVAINLSASDVADASLPTAVLRRLTESQVKAEQLMFEVTESAIMREPQTAIGVIEQLRVAGSRFAIDDFGTGHSSLSQVHCLPVDELKIDRSFISDLAQSERSSMIVRTIIDLAHGLNMKAVAEGVETPETLTLLQRLGCDYAQGYLISRPMAADAVLAWIESRRHSLATAGKQAGPLGELVDLRTARPRQAP